MYEVTFYAKKGKRFQRQIYYVEGFNDIFYYDFEYKDIRKDVLSLGSGEKAIILANKMHLDYIEVRNEILVHVPVMHIVPVEYGRKVTSKKHYYIMYLDSWLDKSQCIEFVLQELAAIK